MIDKKAAREATIATAICGDMILIIAVCALILCISPIVGIVLIGILLLSSTWTIVYIASK